MTDRRAEPADAALPPSTARSQNDARDAAEPLAAEVPPDTAATRFARPPQALRPRPF